MKRTIVIIAALVLLAIPRTADAQKHRSYVIGFYNLENLFDTYHDEGKNDYEYLPDGANEWTEEKYAKKLRNMARVIADMKKDNGAWHAVLGVSEVENRHVLEDLVSEPAIAEANYQIVHYDSPDRRGVDCALFYRPQVFKYITSEAIPFTFEDSRIDWSQWTEEEKEAFRTRDVLMVRGTIDDEMFAFFVCHLPSRLGGKGADLRPRGAEIAYQRAMELQEEFPGINIVVMGDMNDNPTDVSMTDYLHGKEFIKDVTDEDFFDPFLSMIKAGYSSLYYRAWMRQRRRCQEGGVKVSGLGVSLVWPRPWAQVAGIGYATSVAASAAHGLATPPLTKYPASLSSSYQFKVSRTSLSSLLTNFTNP